jgi:hypothetical protein
MGLSASALSWRDRLCAHVGFSTIPTLTDGRFGAMIFMLERSQRRRETGAEIGGAMPPGSQCRDDRCSLRWDGGVAAPSATDTVGSGVIGPHQ